MENLTKQQIVLLTLLVSFVTSIATGIVSVSLLSQEPQGVTQTINRVVEKTIERVVTVPNQGAVVTKETVVVNSEDLTVSSIEKNSKSLVRIYKKVLEAPEAVAKDVFVGVGFVLGKDGLLVTGVGIGKEGGSYFGVFPDGTQLVLSKVEREEEASIFLFRAVKPEKSDFTFFPVVLGDSDKIKLGQTVISLGGNLKNNVSLGIISGFRREEEKTTATTTSSGVPSGEIRTIETNIPAKDVAVGGALLNLSGEVVGLYGEDTLLEKASYLPARFIKADMAAIASGAFVKEDSQKKN